MVGCSLAIWAETLAERNDLDAAIQQAERGMELTERAMDLAMLGWSYLCFVRVLFSRGDMDGAAEIVQRLERTGRESNVPSWIAGAMSAWRARLWLAEGNLEGAAQWARERELCTDGASQPQRDMGFFQLFDYIMLARILIAESRLDEAGTLLERLLDISEAGGRTSRVIEILILKALALHAGTNTAQALTTLERALALAEPEGFIRIFVDEGPLMARLVHKAAARGMMPDYTAKLLTAFADTATDEGKAIVSPSASLVEPLSPRELEVVQLIAQGLTNQAVASRLFLSLNTVKAHTRNIYGKLTVHSRTQAVARAQALGLLPREQV
jgi:LuxR family maltose regulon positive regulatory protein